MKLNLKQKLLFLLFLPLSFIFFMFALLINNTLTNKQNLEETKTYLAEVQCLSKIIHTLQIERGLSVYYVSYKRHQIKESLLQARSNVDVALQSCKSKKLNIRYSPTSFVQKDFEQITKYRQNIENDKLKKMKFCKNIHNLFLNFKKELRLFPH